jgi:hypothetical protein
VVSRDLRTDPNVGRATSLERGATWPAIRALAWIVLAVMAAALGYAGWIALANFDRIGV